jgi:exodeoxyribonuclease VII large subunit
VQRAPRALAAPARDLDAVEAQVRALDPARVLAKGWSITRDAGGRVVRSVAGLVPGDGLVTTLSDGDVRSTVSSPPTPARPHLSGTPADATRPPGSAR